MTLPTKMSIHGFIATAPTIHHTGKGKPRFYCRVGIEQYRKEVDGSVTTLDTAFCGLVAFDRAAEQAYARFRPGDQFVAAGYVHEYEVERPGRPSQIREEFVAQQIGHDCAHTRYVVDRNPAKQPDPPTNEMNVVNEPAQAIGI